jgi:TonB family protein
MEREARRRKLDETPEFKELLAKTTEQLLTAALWNELIRTIKPDEAACQAYYEEHKPEFSRIKLRDLLIRTPGSKWPVRSGRVALTEAQSLAKAQELRKQSMDGAGFAALAKEESDEPPIKSLVSLGWQDRREPGSQFSDSAVAQPFDLTPGEISQPLRDEDGYHLIRVEDKQQKSYAEARPEVERRLKMKLVRKAEEELQIKAAVTLDEEYFSPAPAAGGQANDATSAEAVVDCRAPDSLSALPPGLKMRPSRHRIHQPAGLQRFLLLHGPPPAYPAEAKSAGIQGHVTLFVLISSDGILLEARPSSGDLILTAAAIEAVSQWVWRPTIHSGCRSREGAREIEDRIWLTVPAAGRYPGPHIARGRSSPSLPAGDRPVRRHPSLAGCS